MPQDSLPALSPTFTAVADIIRGHAKGRGDAVATHYQGREITYAELDRRSNQVAHALTAQGIGKGDRVAVIAKNVDHFFDAFFGCAKIGAVLVPVNWRLAAPEMEFICSDSGAKLILVGDGYYDTVTDILPSLPAVTKVLAFDAYDTNAPGFADFRQWFEGFPDTDPGAEVSPGDDMVQLYSSGTTGRPKGVVLTHGASAHLLPVLTTPSIEAYGNWTPDDVNLVVMPLFHVGGFNNALAGFYCGAKTVILPEAVPATILKLIPEHKVTKTFVVPALLLFLLQTPGCRETDFSSVNEIWYGGSPIPLDLLKQGVEVFGPVFGQAYGMTENNGGGCYLPKSEHLPLDAERLKSCGRPAPGQEIRVADESGNALGPREVGEVLVRSKTLMKEYWNRPDATAETLKDGWLHTGDAGYFDEDGYLYIYDRVKDMVVSGGENIYPAEIESALYGHPAIADVAVIGVPDERWGEAVKAIVVKAPGAEITEGEILTYARTRIAGYKVPKSVDFAETLPRNPTGKILKRELRTPYWEGRDRQVN